MKKSILIIAALVMSAVAFAQKPVGSVSIVPQIGMTLTNMSNDRDEVNMDPRFGLTAGAEVQYQLNEKFAILGGALYAQKGIKNDPITWKFDYINIPLMANTYLAPGLAVKLGIQPEILLSSKVDGKSGPASVEGDVKDACKGFLISIPVGISYEISNIVFDLRYSEGLMNALKKETDMNAKHRVLTLTVGYRF